MDKNLGINGAKLREKRRRVDSCFFVTKDDSYAYDARIRENSN